MPFIDINALTNKSSAVQPDPATTPSDTQTPVPTTAPVSDTAVSPAASTVVPPTTEQTAPVSNHPAVEVQTPVITFASTPDVEDPDKAANVPMPEVAVTPGTHVMQNGLREVKGPEFQQPSAATDPLKELENIDMKSRLSQLVPAEPTPSVNAPAAEPTVEMPVEQAVPAQLEIAPVASEPTVESAPIQIDAIPVADPIAPATEQAQPLSPEPSIEVPVASAVESPTATIEAAPAVPEVVPTVAESPAPAESMDVVATIPNPAASTPEPNPVPAAENMEQLISPGQITIEWLIDEALKAKASDLHISPGYRAMLRVDGKLQDLQTPVLTPADTVRLLQDLPKEKVDMETLLDSDFAYQAANGTRFRVNLFRQRNGIAAALRVVSTNIPPLSSLNLPPKIGDFVQVSQGLILVTGPTGSGKSTTIASIVNEINREQPKHIVTIEDPIEYVYPQARSLVDQRNIGEDTESWQDALRAVLRQDPDVVVVGEMRDLETIAAAITTAETGHLVFGTLHTNSAAQSIDRIIDVFPAGQQQQIRTQLANVLVAVVSQRLIPVNGGGRRAALEIMLANSAVRTAVRDGKVHQIDNIIQTSADVGMVAMERSLVELVRAGAISVELAQYYSNKPDEILRLLGSNNR